MPSAIAIRMYCVNLLDIITPSVTWSPSLPHFGRGATRIDVLADKAPLFFLERFRLNLETWIRVECGHLKIIRPDQAAATGTNIAATGTNIYDSGLDCSGGGSDEEQIT